MTSLNTPSNQAIAMAGVLQATFLCKNLANFGRCDADQLAGSLATILRMDTDSVLEVYGQISSINKGLRLLKSQLTATDPDRDLDLSRYSVALIQLGDNVMRHDETLEQLQTGIKNAQKLDFNIIDPVMINNLADIYRNCISHLSPRIMVSGQPEYLNNEQVASKIRASLLAGLRSVVLWRQCGGTRPGMLFGRTRYLRAAEVLQKS